MSGSRIAPVALGPVVALAALVACGDGLVGPDAPTAPGDDRELVQLQFFGDPALSSRTEVFFQAADGSLALATYTDGAGRANALMEPGGTVTVVVRAGSVRWMYTFVDVRSAETLVLDTRRFPRPAMYFLGIPPHPDASFFVAHAACDGRTASAVVRNPAPFEPVQLLECAGPLELLLHAEHEDGPGADYLHEKFPAGSSGALTPGGAYTPYEPSSVALRSAPGAFHAARVDQRIITAGVGATVPFTNGSSDTELSMPLAAGATLTTRVDLLSATTLATPTFVSWGPASATTTLDVAPTLRPFTREPTYDLAHRTLRWEEAAAGAPGDVLVSRITYDRDATSFIWTIIAPRTIEPAVRFPLLPRAELNPHPDHPPHIAALVTLAIDGGYDRIGHRLLGHWAPQALWPVDASSGNVELQIYGRF